MFAARVHRANKSPTHVIGELRVLNEHRSHGARDTCTAVLVAGYAGTGTSIEVSDHRTLVPAGRISLLPTGAEAPSRRAQPRRRALAVARGRQDRAAARGRTARRPRRSHLYGAGPASLPRSMRRCWRPRALAHLAPDESLGFEVVGGAGYLATEVTVASGAGEGSEQFGSIGVLLGVGLIWRPWEKTSVQARFSRFSGIGNTLDRLQPRRARAGAGARPQRRPARRLCLLGNRHEGHAGLTAQRAPLRSFARPGSQLLARSLISVLDNGGNAHAAGGADRDQARPEPRSASCLASVATMRAPVAANGWPSATLEPLGLIFARSIEPSGALAAEPVAAVVLRFPAPSACTAPARRRPRGSRRCRSPAA